MVGHKHASQRIWKVVAQRMPNPVACFFVVKDRASICSSSGKVEIPHVTRSEQFLGQVLEEGGGSLMYGTPAAQSETENIPESYQNANLLA